MYTILLLAIVAIAIFGLVHGLKNQENSPREDLSHFEQEVFWDADKNLIVDNPKSQIPQENSHFFQAEIASPAGMRFVRCAVIKPESGSWVSLKPLAYTTPARVVYRGGLGVIFASEDGCEFFFGYHDKITPNMQVGAMYTIKVKVAHSMKSWNVSFEVLDQ